MNTAAATTTRIAYRKVNDTEDYVDARFDVLLDGEKIGQVTRNVENVGHGPAAQRFHSYVTPTTLWEFEGRDPSGRDYRQFVEYRVRMDAVIGFLTNALGMGHEEARAAVGKRGI